MFGVKIPGALMVWVADPSMHRDNKGIPQQSPATCSKISAMQYNSGGQGVGTINPELQGSLDDGRALDCANCGLLMQAIEHLRG